MFAVHSHCFGWEAKNGGNRFDGYRALGLDHKDYAFFDRCSTNAPDGMFCLWSPFAIAVKVCDKEISDDWNIFKTVYTSGQSEDIYIYIYA